ncbi:MAG: ABC transporter substrate-binding protein [Thermotogae bacterium]|nr:ABC transporter substrate-binding protein [Thermotogota bacterium]
MRTYTAILFVAILSCQPSQRGGIVSLAPSADEIIVRLGAKDKLVGVSTYSKVKGVDVVGDLVNPDYERIVALKPDVVIIVLPMHRRVKSRLKELNIETYDFSPESPDELIYEVENLGKLVNRKEEAQRLADSVKRLISSIKPVGKFTFYVELSSKPVFVAGGDTYIASIVSMFGGENLFRNLKGYVPVSTEDILSKRPDIVFSTQKMEDRIGMKACVVRLEHDHVSPGISIFQLIPYLKSSIDSCLKKMGG